MVEVDPAFRHSEKRSRQAVKRQLSSMNDDPMSGALYHSIIFLHMDHQAVTYIPSIFFSIDPAVPGPSLIGTRTCTSEAQPPPSKIPRHGMCLCHLYLRVYGTREGPGA